MSPVSEARSQFHFFCLASYALPNGSAIWALTLSPRLLLSLLFVDLNNNVSTTIHNCYNNIIVYPCQGPELRGRVL